MFSLLPIYALVGLALILGVKALIQDQNDVLRNGGRPSPILEEL
jgi:hypothetical protein